jgi:hypothetical protein
MPESGITLPAHFHGATIQAEAASLLRLPRSAADAPLTRLHSRAISPRRVCRPWNSAYRLYRKAETGKRLMGSAQAISIR